MVSNSNNENKKILIKPIYSNGWVNCSKLDQIGEFIRVFSYLLSELLSMKNT